MVSVRIGKGSLNKFECWSDVELPSVPNIGDHVVYEDKAGGFAATAVKRVEYRFTSDHKFIGVVVSV